MRVFEASHPGDRSGLVPSQPWHCASLLHQNISHKDISDGLDASVARVYTWSKLALLLDHHNLITTYSWLAYSSNSMFHYILGSRCTVTPETVTVYEDSLGFDNDKGFPEAAVLLPKSPCTSSKILSAFRARIFDISSGRDVSAVSTCRGFSCHGYCVDS